MDTILFQRVVAALSPGAIVTNEDNTYEGAVWADSVLRPSAEAFALKAAQIGKREAITARAGASLSAGFEWNGVLYQIDAQSQDRIGNRRAFARDCIDGLAEWSPVYQGWIAADNSRVSFPTPQDFVAFAHAAHAYVTQVVLTSRSYKDAIAAARSSDKVEALDVSAGWPEE